MRITHCRSVHLATLALGLTMTVASAAAQSTHVLVPADKLQWGPAPPQLPAGAQVSVLEGNPADIFYVNPADDPQKRQTKR